MGTIKLHKMEFFSYHGCFEEETVVGNYFNVDLSIKTPTQRAEASDNLEDALNYQLVYNVVEAEMAKPSKLLEHVGRRILTALYATFNDKILKVKITVQKMNPPLGGKMQGVSVTLEE